MNALNIVAVVLSGIVLILIIAFLGLFIHQSKSLNKSLSQKQAMNRQKNTTVSHEEGKNLINSKIRDLEKMLHTIQEETTKVKQNLQNKNRNTENFIKKINKNIDDVLTFNERFVESKNENKIQEINIQTILKNVFPRDEKNYNLNYVTKTHHHPNVLIYGPDQKNNIVIDSFFKINAYFQYIHADKKMQEEKWIEINNDLQKQILQLNKKYVLSEENFLMVIKYLPHDKIIEKFIEKNEQIVQYALKNKIILVGPSSLYAILSNINYYFEQAKYTNIYQNKVNELLIIKEKINNIKKEIQGNVLKQKSLAVSQEKLNQNLNQINKSFLKLEEN